MARKKKKADHSQENGLQGFDSILAEISARLAKLEGGQGEKLLAGLDECLELADQAHRTALEEDQPWLAAWIALQKASLHSDLAEFSGAMGRAVQIHSAMNLIVETADSIPGLPANLDLAARLYIDLTGILLRIRTFFEEEEQLQALDDLVRGCAENLGQLLAQSQSLKIEAADLMVTARMIEVLDHLEGSPQQGQISRDLDHQAAALLNLAGGCPAQLRHLSGEGR